MTTQRIDSANNSPEILDDFEGRVPEEDIQEWSALTLVSLQRKLDANPDDPQYSEAKILIDKLAADFSSTDPIEIADYFEAVQKVNGIVRGGVDHLAGIEGPQLTAVEH